MLDEWTAGASLTRIEEEVQRFWRRHGVPEAARAARRDGPSFVLYQQPLFVAGQPAMEQARLLATADLFARYRSMRGDAVHRRAGWASHGLPLEVAVERALGADLGSYDLARFSAACRQAAAEGQRQAQARAERLGVWLDPEDSYDTLAPESIGAVWGALRRLWDAGRLARRQRIVSVCPRCATPLSDAEAARHAVEVEARTVWLQLPWRGEPDTYFLTWTPAPWMLVGMAGLAAHPDATYALVEVPAREGQPPIRLLLAEEAVGRAPLDRPRLVRRLPGRALRGARYHPPFTFLPAGQEIDRVVLSADVPLARGSGLLPLTPAFDSFSLALARAHGLPVPNLLDDWGALSDVVTPWRGLTPLDADPLIVSNLNSRGLVWRQRLALRPQALCPHCQTALLPQAREVWLVETAGGPWVVGRDRAWGAPLPLWTCKRCGQQICLAGLDDLARRLGLDVAQIDAHRPAVDRLVLPCETCGGSMRRVAEAVDAAFEAAVLPWASAALSGPAHLAIGLGDEHLGWLGDLTELGALLREALAWEQALALPQSRMSGTEAPASLSPADRQRWAIYTGTTPEEAERAFLHPLWQLAGVLLGAIPRDASHLGYSDGALAFLDRWLAARLHHAGDAIAAALDACEPGSAAGALAALLADLDRWFVPCRPGHGPDMLQTLARLLAPFVPHLAEAIFYLAGASPGESVHLADWPAADLAAADEALLARMVPVWRLARLGQRAREQAGLGAQQRLRRGWVQIVVRDPAEAVGLTPFRDLLAGVLGVDRLEIAEDDPLPVTWHLSLDQERAVTRRIPADPIAAALVGLSPAAAAQMATNLRAGLSVGLDVGAETITLLPDEVRVSVQARPGWVAAEESGYLVGLQIG